MNFEYCDPIMFKEEMDISLRTIRARGVVLSRDTMLKFRIRGIFNSVGETEVMTDEYIDDFASSVFRPEYGEIASVERSMKTIEGVTNPLVVVSVIVFADIWSWHMFALHEIDIYLAPGRSASGLETLVN